MEEFDPYKEEIVDSGIPQFQEDDFRKPSINQGQLKILHLTDIHLQFDKIKLLQNWYFQKGKRKYDLMLVSGDMGTINHFENPSQEDQRYQEEQIELVFQELYKLGIPIYYIGGNHDPSSLYLDKEKRPVFGKNSHNVHNCLVKLKPNLCLISLGGSFPSKFLKHGSDQFEPIYVPYHYENELDFQKDLELLLAQAKSSQIILMTHDGPYGSSTTIDKTERQNTGVIYFGSPAFNDMLRNNQERVVCNIHGHCHEGSNVDKINKLRIINSGPLQFGEFGEITLSEGDNGKWRVSKVIKQYLQ